MPHPSKASRTSVWIPPHGYVRSRSRGEAPMFNYYLRLALKSLKRNLVLTSLMIAAIGVGIGAAMTIYTVLLVMSGDPIPDKSSRLFVPTIDNWGPKVSNQGTIDQ